MDKKETLEFIERQIELEHKIIRVVSENTEKLGNAFVKDLLRGIAQDSEKHAALLASLKRAIEGPTPFISEGERDKIADGIKEHIALEAEAVKMYGKLIDETDNDQVRTIAAMIREDEIKHHKLLHDLHKAVLSLLGFESMLSKIRSDV